MDELLEWRKEFPILDNTVYLDQSLAWRDARRTRDRLKGTQTCGRRAAFARGRKLVDDGHDGWRYDWRGLSGGRGGGNAPKRLDLPVDHCLCFAFGSKRNKIVSESLNFPSNLYIYHSLEERARFVTVPSDDGITVPLDRLLDEIDEQTLLVSVSHVIFRSSFFQDLMAFAVRAHEVGAFVVADIYQSAGTVPLNVRELDLDFATGGSVKWLCGGPGAGYLYVKRDLWSKLEPRLTGWLAHEDPFAFEIGPNRYADNIIAS
jgi:kynureninase